METKELFSIWNHHKCLLLEFIRFTRIPMLWVYGYYKYFNSFSVGTVFIRQILTYKDGPHTERADHMIITGGLEYSVFYFIFLSTINSSFWTSIDNISKSLTSILSNLNNSHSLEVVEATQSLFLFMSFTWSYSRKNVLKGSLLNGNIN